MTSERPVVKSYDAMLVLVTLSFRCCDEHFELGSEHLKKKADCLAGFFYDFNGGASHQVTNK